MALKIDREDVGNKKGLNVRHLKIIRNKAKLRLNINKNFRSEFAVF
jgi:hypothetical protein